jgi:hypothetical protein
MDEKGMIWFENAFGKCPAVIDLFHAVTWLYFVKKRKYRLEW